MFWNNFYNLCESNGVKPLNVVKSLSLASGSITKWKNGTIPSGKTLQKISEYFNVSVDSLLGENGPDKTEQKEKPTLNLLDLVHGVGLPSDFASKLSKEAIDEIYKKIVEEYGSSQVGTVQKATLVTDEEWEQLKLLRTLNEKGKKKAIEYLDDLSTNPNYKKEAADNVDDLAGNPNYVSEDKTVYLPTAAFDGRFTAGEKVPYTVKEICKLLNSKGIQGEDF